MLLREALQVGRVSRQSYLDNDVELTTWYEPSNRAVRIRLFNTRTQRGWVQEFPDNTPLDVVQHNIRRQSSRLSRNEEQQQAMTYQYDIPVTKIKEKKPDAEKISSFTDSLTNKYKDEK